MKNLKNLEVYAFPNSKAIYGGGDDDDPIIDRPKGNKPPGSEDD